LSSFHCTRQSCQSCYCCIRVIVVGIRSLVACGHHGIAFDESHPFYPRHTTDASPASLVDPLSFLLFPDAPPVSLPIPRSTLPSSMSSSETPLVVPDYMVKPPVTQFYSRHGARSSDAPASSDELPFDVPSSSFTEDVTSSPSIEPSSLTDLSLEHLVRHSHRLCRLPDCYSPLVFTATTFSEPASYRDAILHPEWQRVMAEEIAALEQISTWDLMPCPPRVRPITCKWVCNVKTRSDGSLEHYKVHLVARGFQQEQGRDYDDTFAHVAHMTTIHTLLVVASIRKWSISQHDMKNAFLNGELCEDVYMRPPLGYYIPKGVI
jgi:hypothetical protein